MSERVRTPALRTFGRRKDDVEESQLNSKIKRGKRLRGGAGTLTLLHCRKGENKKTSIIRIEMKNSNLSHASIESTQTNNCNNLVFRTFVLKKF